MRSSIGVVVALRAAVVFWVATPMRMAIAGE
jgi:hypothetical protein